jgi:hypothetical protein
MLGKKAKTAAQKAGLAVSPIPILLVEGDNKPGLGAAIGEALADAGALQPSRVLIGGAWR